MWATPEYIKACEKLHKDGLRIPFSEGDRVARGFADLGHELFLILPGPILLSLQTGKTKELTNSEKEHLFAVPSVDVLVEQLHIKGADTYSITTEDNRTWVITVTHGNNNSSFSAKSVEMACITALRKLSA